MASQQSWANENRGHTRVSMQNGLANSLRNTMSMQHRWVTTLEHMICAWNARRLRRPEKTFRNWQVSITLNCQADKLENQPWEDYFRARASRKVVRRHYGESWSQPWEPMGFTTCGYELRRNGIVAWSVKPGLEDFPGLWVVLKLESGTHILLKSGLEINAELSATSQPHRMKRTFGPSEHE